jgi:hypothetical protein
MGFVSSTRFDPVEWRSPNSHFKTVPPCCEKRPLRVDEASPYNALPAHAPEAHAH